MAIHLLGSRPGEVVTNVLLELTATTNGGRDRIAAIKALAGRPNDRAITGSLVELCRDGDVAVRHVAIRAMASRRGNEVVRWLNQLADSGIQDRSLDVMSAADATACYETLIEIADSAQQWPAEERETLLDAAAERLTLALTGR